MKKVIKIALLILFGLFMLGVVIGLLSPKGRESFEKGLEEGAGQKIPTTTPTPTPIPKPSYEELGTYRRGDKTWKNIMVSPEITRKELIHLAKEIHRNDPEGTYNLFDDKEQFEAFKLWDIHYVEDAEDYPYPEEWIDEHHIAIINRMGYSATDLRWQLYFMILGGNRFHEPGDLAVDLE